MRRPNPCFILSVFLLLSLFPSTRPRGQTSPAATYNAVKDFSAAQNPSGAWSYGYRTADGPFTPYASATKFFGAGAASWQAAAAACCPMVTKNVSGTTYTYPNAPSVVHHPAFLNVHPGPPGQRSVVRWTAPAAGSYKVLGQFEGIDTNGTSSDVRVVHNAAVLFSGSVNGFGVAAPFTLVVKAAAGDAVEFSVGAGSNGTHNYDSTGLHATVAPAPASDAVTTAPDNLATVNFDNVAAGSLVNNQYRPHVTFSPNGFSAGPSWPALLAHDVRAQPAAVFGGSSPNAIASLWNNCPPGPACVNNGITATSYVDVNVIVPTLSSFMAEQSADRVTDSSDCEGVFTPTGPAYVAGCQAITINPEAPPPNHLPGIKFAASAQIPAAQYLSDPAQSGIKFVQIINTQRKFLAWGDTWCWGTRNRQPAPEWMVDTVDPYGGVRLFSTGNSLTTREEDSPQRTLTTSPVPSDASQYISLDAFSVDERFEMYVVYFTGANPARRSSSGPSGSPTRRTTRTERPPTSRGDGAGRCGSVRK